MQGSVVMCFPPRDSQTRVKHEIVRQYCGAWAGIICTGIGGQAALRERQREVDLVYLDVFAGCGCYDGDADKDDAGNVWGSPIIAAQALGVAKRQFETDYLRIRLSVIAVEQTHSGELLSSARTAGVGLPVRQAQKLDRGARGAFTVIQADCRHLIEDMVTQFRDTDFVLAFVDPYGESMSMRQLRTLLAHPRTDGVTLFPVAEIDKHGGCARKAPSERAGGDIINVSRTTEHFATDEWQDIARSSMNQHDREAAYTALYDRQLRLTDPSLVVKNIGLRFSKLGRTGYHLFLTTRNANGALRMNAILRDADIREHWELWCDREARIRADGQESLFVVEYTGPERETISREEAAEMLQARLPHYGEKLSWRQLRGLMAEDLLTETEIQKGMRFLKRKEMVMFDGTGRDDEIVVLT